MSKLTPEEIEAHINACEDMYHAAGHGRAEKLRDALDRGANVNFIRSDQGIVMVALSRRSLECVEMLLEAGADPSQSNRMGWAPLHEASAKNYAELIPALVKAGADPNRADLMGETPLAVAIREKSAEAAKLLMQLDASIDAADYDGMTPPMWAVSSELPDVLAALVAAGANLDLTNSDGRTALDMARESGWALGQGILEQARMAQKDRPQDSEAPAAPAAVGLSSIRKVKL